MCDVHQLWQLADSLKLSPPPERRAAISRAYYAAFHAVQPIVLPMIRPDDVGRHGCARHSATLHALRNWGSGHPDRRLAMQHGAAATQAYHRLAYCKDEREFADYLLGSNNDPEPKTAVDVIGKAKRVIDFASRV